MPTKWEYTKDYLNTKIFARFSPAVSIPDQDQRRISVLIYLSLLILLEVVFLA
jgi:hypothetical protein